MLDMTKSSLRGLLKRDEPIGVFWLALGSLPVAEIAARSAADAIVLDLQHGLFDRNSLESAVVVAGSACPVLARVADNSAVSIGMALDAGAEGILVPLVESAEEVATAVSLARFPPAGKRSGGGVRPLGSGFAAYLAASEERTVVGVMIETAAGVENAEAIAGTAGLDFVLIGTGDLALSIGGGDGNRAPFDAACARILRACQEVGLPCGIFTMDAAAALARKAEGYRIVVLANDIDVVGNGFRSAVSRFKAG